MIEESVENIVQACIKKWGRDSRTENLEDLVHLWLNNIDKADASIFLRLLKNFNYYTKKSEANYAKFIIDNVNKFDPNKEETIFIPLLKPEETISGAYKILRSIQLVGKLNPIKCPTNLCIIETTYDTDLIKNIVIVDDISGTGRTLKRSLQYMKSQYGKIFINKRIYVSCLVTSESAMEYIKLDKSINYLQYNIIKKAFDDNNIFISKEANEAKIKVKKYEEMLTKDDKELFGYGNSELLVAFSDDTPNNTLLSFWKNGKQWNPIFPRTKRDNIPPWAKKRHKQNIKKNIGRILKEY